MPGNVAGILLAAGAGSRLGQPKALVMLGGLSLALRGIATLRAGGTDPVIVVTGAADLGPEPAVAPSRPWPRAARPWSPGRRPPFRRG